MVEMEFREGKLKNTDISQKIAAGTSQEYLGLVQMYYPIVDIRVGIHQDSGLIQLGLIRPPGPNPNCMSSQAA